MSLKKQLGQFYTTNYEYIMTNIIIPTNINEIIEPFVGNGELLKFIKKFNKQYNIECYDIDPKISAAKKQDTLIYPPNYSNKYIITNPPYLARNKSENKEIYDKYQTNDLYKCFIQELTQQNPIGGIIIIPLNFWCSIRKNDVELRKKFLKKFSITLVNIFEEQVFDDTTYSICCVQFITRDDENYNIPFYIFPSKKLCIIEINEKNNFTIGGELYNLSKNSNYKIGRLIKGMKPNTNILLKCIDDNVDSKLGLTIVDNDDLYYDNTPKKSERSYATLTIEPKISLKKQKELINKFNKFLNENREKYNSLFLTNFRESNSIARKRISFQLVYDILGYLLIQ